MSPSRFLAKCHKLMMSGFTVLLLVVPTVLVAQRRLELDDYYRLVSLNSPAISPDGLRVAYVRSRIVEEQNRMHSEIWLVNTDGSAPAIRLSSSAFSSSNPQWSPDGALLSFSSARRIVETNGETDNSIWFLRMDVPAGEAFHIEGVEGTPIFSPDSRWIAFVDATPPQQDEAPDTRSDVDRKIEERFDGRIYDWMNYRFDRRGYLRDPRDLTATPPRELYVVTREGGEPRRLTDLGVDVQAPAWRSDTEALVFTADSHQRDEYSYERADVWIVDLLGNVTRLTDDWFNYSNPAWSPDGQLIVVRGSEGLDSIIARKQSHGSPIDLFLLPASGGEPRNITGGWDLMPGSPSWSSDGRYVYFSAGIGGNTHLFRVPAVGGPVEQVTEGNRQLSGISFSERFDRIAYSAADPTHPGDIFAAKVDGSREAQLTQSNGELPGDLGLSAAEQLAFPSQDGTQVEGWLMYPHGYEEGRTYPLILTIHGGPHGSYGNEFSFSRQLLTAHGYFVLYINPRGSTGYGEDFKWAIWGGWGVLDYQDIMAGVDYVLERYPVDPDRLGVTGASYGGFMTNWIIGHTTRFAAAVARASISNWMSDYGTADIPRTKESEFFGPPWEKQSRDLMIELSPLTYAGAVTTPTLFLHGELDHRVPIEEAEQMYVALKKRRVPAKFIRYPDSYHGGWTPWRQLHAYRSELEWWERYLQ